MKKSQSYSNKDYNEHVFDLTSFNYYLTHDFHKLINKNSNKQIKSISHPFIQIHVPCKVILINLNNYSVALNMNLISLTLQKPGTRKEM